ncbi:MAG: hypothetical protein PHF60_01475 [Candidatus ainarchaeum sp.]|nr:hypothetical protein [Candidatus ainarchaeum sp.]
MRQLGERLALGDKRVKRLALSAMKKAAEKAEESFRRHVKIAKALAGFLPFTEKIEELETKGKIILFNILVSRPNGETEHSRDEFAAAKDGMGPERL